MPNPYKLYINWTGTYTFGSMSGSFTELTDSELFDVNISVSRKRDDKSIAIIRTFADGYFTIKNNATASNYDLLKTAISNGLPELIIMIERYSVDGAAYVEMWRGAVETRPAEMDDNRQEAKLSKFKTIDDYSDVMTGFDRTYKQTFTEYIDPTFGVIIEDLPANSVRSAYRMFSLETQQSGGFQDLSWIGAFSRKYNTLALTKMVEGYYDGTYHYYFGEDQSEIQGQRGIFVASARTVQTTDDTILSMSLKMITDIHRDMFNLHWFYGEIIFSGTKGAIQFKHPSELFGGSTIDYTTQSADFAAFSYIDVNYFIREKFEMSTYNLDIDHITQSFEYNLLAEIEKTHEQSKILTDPDSIFTAGYGDQDFLIFQPTQEDQTNDSKRLALAQSGTQINGSARTVYNYKSSLSYRMEQHLDDYRQLTPATFNGSSQAVNASIAAPSLEQEPFPIELDLLSDLDFTDTFETSIGDTFAQEVQLDLKTNVIKLICRK